MRRILEALLPTTAAVLYIVRSCRILRWGLRRSFSDFALCFSAFQRAASVDTAYIEFVAALLPSGTAPRFKVYAQRFAHSTRHGSILAGPDINTYFDVLFRLGAPICLYVNIYQPFIPKSVFRPEDSPRCGGVPSAGLGEYRFT